MMNDERCVLVRYSRVVYHGVSILFRRTVEHHRYFIIEYGNVSDLGWDPPPAPRPPRPPPRRPPRHRFNEGGPP